jgi:hypothetical protein
MVQSQSVSSPDMDRVWETFLRYRVNSFIKWDLVRFFYDNPHTVDTAENIATTIGRDTRTVQRELDGLVSADVLDANTVGGGRVYRYSNNPESRRLVADFMRACHNREFRVKAIQHVIAGLGFSSHHDF